MALNLWKAKVDGLINQGCLLWVNVNCNGSISTKITFPTSPYKIFLNDSNGHGCYFKNILLFYSLNNICSIIHKPYQIYVKTCI